MSEREYRAVRCSFSFCSNLRISENGYLDAQDSDQMQAYLPAGVRGHIWYNDL